MQDLQQTYTAAMDSVNLINNGQPADTTNEEWADTVRRNVDHLKIVVAKEWTEGFDLTPFNDVISANS